MLLPVVGKMAVHTQLYFRMQGGSAVRRKEVEEQAGGMSTYTVRSQDEPPGDRLEWYQPGKAVGLHSVKWVVSHHGWGLRKTCFLQLREHAGNQTGTTLKEKGRE